MTGQSDCDKDVKSETLVAFLHLLESPVAFNNIILRLYIYCILQVLSGRVPPRDETLRMEHTKTSNELKNIFATLIKQSIPTEPSSGHPHFPLDLEGQRETDSENDDPPKAVVTSPGPDRSVTFGAQMITNAPSDDHEQRNSALLLPKDDLITIPKVQVLPEGQEPMESVSYFLDDNFIDAEASSIGILQLQPDDNLPSSTGKLTQICRQVNIHLLLLSVSVETTLIEVQLALRKRKGSEKASEKGMI
ncbi:uncharacterized protein [Primulina huaijiensis]